MARSAIFQILQFQSLILLWFPIDFDDFWGPFPGILACAQRTTHFLQCQGWLEGGFSQRRAGFLQKGRFSQPPVQGPLNSHCFAEVAVRWENTAPPPPWPAKVARSACAISPKSVV